MIDQYAQTNPRNITAPASRHYEVTPDDDADLERRPRALFIATDGDVAVRDEEGVDVTYSLSAGDIFPFRPVRVLATGTTATVIGWE